MGKGSAAVVVVLAAALVGLLSYGVAQRGEDRSIDAAVLNGSGSIRPGPTRRSPSWAPPIGRARSPTTGARWWC
jgi:hypothetical protein